MKVGRLFVPVVVLLMLLAGSVSVTAWRRLGGPSRGASLLTSTRGSAARALPEGSLVVSELHGDETLLLNLSAADPTDRRPLVRIPHAAGVAPRATVAPGGDMLAYTVLPPGATSPDREGVLWVIALQEREPRRLAASIDVRTTPVWAPDGSRVVYLRSRLDAAGAMTLTLEEAGARDGKARELAAAPASARLFPAGYAPDGSLFYYVRFDDGATLHAVATGTLADRTIARLGDGAARDFSISPDGATLVYLSLDGAPPRYHAMAVDLASGDVRPVLAGVNRAEDVGVVWQPGPPAWAVVGFITGEAEANGRIAVEGSGAAVTQRASGFDVPEAWSPDGRFLVLRSFSGANADDPGREQPSLLDRGGERTPLTGDGPIEFIGWVTHAP